jgi:hypothetical protein
MYNTTGSGNLASGYQALKLNTTGNYNVASGTGALHTNTTGANNVASGYQALNSNTTGNDNVASGYKALYSNTTGNNNTSYGFSSGYSSTGSGNVFLGYESGYNKTGDNKLVIGNSSSSELIYGEFDNEVLKFNAAVTTTKALYTSAIETITASSDVLDNSNYIILADASSNTVTLNLPAASGNTGLTYIIKRTDAAGSYAVILDANASETIDGSTTYTLTSQYQSIRIICDGSNWYIM